MAVFTHVDGELTNVDRNVDLQSRQPRWRPPLASFINGLDVLETTSSFHFSLKDAGFKGKRWSWGGENDVRGLEAGAVGDHAVYGWGGEWVGEGIQLVGRVGAQQQAVSASSPHACSTLYLTTALLSSGSGRFDKTFVRGSKPSDRIAVMEMTGWTVCISSCLKGSSVLPQSIMTILYNASSVFFLPSTAVAQASCNPRRVNVCPPFYLFLPSPASSSSLSIYQH
ncbi:hypothetical protein R3P38DRAFT_3182549 [Favolaschia claudopus]|uniref:Uncharacterized protein n=1 Tax=Favolaschia claudopus TaxID=2862362 RepID=A0AAW0CG19_9AGAR